MSSDWKILITYKAQEILGESVCLNSSTNIVLNYKNSLYVHSTEIFLYSHQYDWLGLNHVDDTAGFFSLLFHWKVMKNSNWSNSVCTNLYLAFFWLRWKFFLWSCHISLKLTLQGVCLLTPFHSAPSTCGVIDMNA